MAADRTRFAAIFACAAALYLATAHPRVFAAGNDASRFAQIESLLDYGTATIERSRYGTTVDRVELDGRVYSNKPPFLSFVGAALYWPLQALTGWRFSNPDAEPSLVRWLTFLLVGLPAALGVALFDRALAGRPSPDRALLTVGLAAGTLVFSFAGTLNPHVPAATLVLAAALATRAGRPLSAGLAIGVAVAVDLLPGLGFVPFVALALAFEKDGRSARLLRFAAGLVPGFAGLLATNVATTGSWRTPKLMPGAVDLSAQAGPSVAGVLLPDSWLYPVELLLGSHGLFVVSPILLLGAAGLWRATRSEAPRERRFWRAMAAAMVAQFLGHALLAGSYGGWSYGYRYLLPIQPLLLFAGAHALEAPRRRTVFAALLVPSVVFAALGAYHPWPPAFEQQGSGVPEAMMVKNPIGANAAAFAARHAPDSGAAQWLGRRFVSRDEHLRQRYYLLFFASRGDRDGVQHFMSDPSGKTGP